MQSYPMKTMNNLALIFVHAACAVLLLTAACSKSSNKKLQGQWKEKNGNSELKITEKKFSLDGGEAEAEDYFMKGDTIFTSFEGAQPYTKFVVKKVDEHTLQLLGPDSVKMEFSR